MKKKNGFTLVEVMVTIMIIALLFGIGVPVYMVITKNIKQSSYENKVSYALTKAEEWASATGRNVVNIGHLIDEGYMEPDDESGAYDNPIDNSSMLCYTIRIDYKDRQYSSYLSGEEYCDYADLEKQTSIIDLVKINESGSVVGEDDWTRDNLLLRIQFKTEEDRNRYQDSVVEIAWNGNGESSNVIVNHDFSTKNSFQVQASQFMNTRYEATVKIIDEDRTFIYKAYSQVKIDRQNPIIYQDEIAVDRFDEWTSSNKGVHVVSSDFDGSGIYGYYTTMEMGACKTDKNAYTPIDHLNFDLSLQQGEYYACVMDNVGNVSDSSKITVIKTDNEPPTLTDFTIDSYTKTLSYYSQLVLRVGVVDHESGASSIKYCLTTSSSCTPSNIYKVDASGFITIPYTKADPNPQRVCAIGIDYAGNESQVKCSDGYLFDNTAPVINSLEAVKQNHHYVLNFSANDTESGIYSYEISLGYTESNMSKVHESITTNTSGSVNLDDLEANHKYYVKLEATNNAGIKTETKHTFTAQFTMDDAQYQCNVSNGYCNEGVYVKYSDRLFALYKGVGQSTFAVNLDNNTEMSLIRGFCCDQGYCNLGEVTGSHSGIYSNYGYEDIENYGNARVYFKTLKYYYDRLNSPTRYLNQESFSFGIAPRLALDSYQPQKSLRAYYGLLDLSEYNQIYSKEYMNGLGTILSTVYPFCDSDDMHYVCGRTHDSIMAIYALNGGLSTKSVVVGNSYKLLSNGAMVVPFKNGLNLTGGTGTRINPYTIE